jgi:hypothetical protein
MVQCEFDDDLPDIDQIVDSVSGIKLSIVSGYTLLPANDKAKQNQASSKSMRT